MDAVFLVSWQHYSIVSLFFSFAHSHAHLSSLLLCSPNIDGVLSESHALHGLVQEASRLAEGVSCKVRALDLAKSRVFECMKRVDDILDLKDCVDGVQDAMAMKDYEKVSGQQEKNKHEYPTETRNLYCDTHTHTHTHTYTHTHLEP